MQASALCVIVPLFAFGLPLLIGLSLLGSHKSDFTRWAAYMTLKPLLATPLFILLMAVLSDSMRLSGANCLPLTLPGILLTVWITHRFAGDSFLNRPYATFLLLALDVLRWGSSSLLMTPGNHPSLEVLSYAMPAVFALTALVLSYFERPAYAPQEARQKSRKLKEDFVYSSVTGTDAEPVPAPEQVKQRDTIRLVDGEVAEVVEDDPRLIKRKRG